MMPTGDASGNLPTRRAILTGLALAATSGLAYAGTPRRAQHAMSGFRLDTTIPSTLGNWRFTSSRDVIVAPSDRPIEGYDQVLARVYTRLGDVPVMLLIAYGSTQGGNLQLHRPDTCYAGQGFRLDNRHMADVRLASGFTLPCEAFTAQRDERIEQVLFWTRVGTALPRSSGQEYAAILRSVASGVVPDGVLFRLSTLGRDGPASIRTLSAFAATLLAAVSKPDRVFLTGDLSDVTAGAGIP